MLFVDLHHYARDKLLLIELQIGEHGFQRRDKVPPDDRLVRYLRHLASGNALTVDDFEVFFQEGLTADTRTPVVKEHMKSIEILVFGIDAVSGKASAEAVGTNVHRLHGLGDKIAGHLFTILGDNGSDGAAGGNANLSFFFHVNLFPWTCVHASSRQIWN